MMIHNDFYPDFFCGLNDGTTFACTPLNIVDLLGLGLSLLFIAIFITMKNKWRILWNDLKHSLKIRLSVSFGQIIVNGKLCTIFYSIHDVTGGFIPYVNILAMNSIYSTIFRVQTVVIDGRDHVVLLAFANIVGDSLSLLISSPFVNYFLVDRRASTIEHIGNISHDIPLAGSRGISTPAYTQVWILPDKDLSLRQQEERDNRKIKE